DTPDVSEVLWGLWTFHMLRAEMETARQIAEEFLHLSERLPYPGIAMRGHWALEITFTHAGNLVLALDHFNKALALYDPTQHRDDSFLYALNPGVAMPCFAAWALWCIGRPDQALARIEEALTLAREHGLALYGAMAMIMQAWSASKYGGAREAVDQIREGLAAIDATGTFLVRPHFLALLAEVLAK